jgi:hypothetical protein
MGALTHAAAGRWTATAPRVQAARVWLVLGWVVAFAIAVASDGYDCTPLDPSVCAPGPFEAAVMTVALATPVLLVWLPVVGCLAGVAAALLFVAVGEPTPVTVSFGLHAVACAVVASGLLRARRDGRRLARSLAGGRRRSAPPIDPDVAAAVGDPRTAWDPLRVGAAVVAILVGIGLLGWTRHLEVAESEHLGRAIPVTGEVVASTYGEVTLVLEGPVHAGRRHDVFVLSESGYPVGANLPVLVDPTDPGWVRLVAEPFDPTGWQGAGLGALLLGAILGAREARRRWLLQTLWLGEHPALEVLVVPDVDDDVLVFPHDVDPTQAEPVAWAGVAVTLPASAAALEDVGADEDVLPGGAVGEGALDPELRRQLADEWRSDASVAVPVEPEPAVLLGDPSPGGWVLVVLEDTVLVPATPLRPIAEVLPLHERWRRWWRSRVDRLPVTMALPVAASGPTWRQAEAWPPGEPVDAATAGDVAGSVEATPPPRVRVLGVALVLASVGGPAAAVLLAEGWFQRLVALLGGGQALVAGVWRLATRLRAGAGEVRVANGWWRHRVSWGALYGIRRDADRLLLAWEPDVVLELPPLGTGEDEGEAGAVRLGAALERLRQRAADAGAASAVDARRGGVGWWLLVGYLGVAIVTVLALATGTVAGPTW